jgi:hypothetical protein
MRHIIFVALTVLGCSAALMAAEPTVGDELTKADRKAITEELVPAVRLGDLAAVTRSGTVLSGRLKPAQRAEVDRMLAENGLPPLADLVTDARFQLIELGLVKSASAVPPQEALILLATLKARTEKLLAKGNEHPAFEKTAPTTLDDFEKLFWSMHVFANQMESAARFCDFAQGLKATAEKFKPKGKTNDTSDVAVLQTDWTKIKSDLAALWERFALQDRDLRVARLTLADKVLTESKDVGERLLAALAVDMDGELLPALLEKDLSFPPEQRQKLVETIDHARTGAGRELLQKSRLLFTGLHWWLRGRYGVGTVGGGLLKDTAALKSPDVMFGLLMPINPPNPTAPGAREPVPLVDRRHHYLWQFETRELTGNLTQRSTSQTKFVPISGSVTTTTYFY